MMINFTNESMIEIIETLKKIKEEYIKIIVLNPDIKDDLYTGTKIKLDSKEYIYRDMKSWLELASILKMKFLTPKIVDEKNIELTYKKLNFKNSFHHDDSNDFEKYGDNSNFAKLNKNEEPSFIYYYLEALKNVKIDKRINILNLGVNDASEFDVIKNISLDFKSHNLVGVDFSKTAIENAKKKYKDYSNVNLFCHDINELESLNLEKFDLIISIGTLQSSNLNFNETFMKIVQNYLKKDGSMILAFPNCRWIDTQMLYGAMVKNYSYSELSVLFKDANFCKRYLQQKKFRVTLTGKDYIFLTASSIIK